MDKINFVNGSAPALNATNLNQLQKNIEEALLAMKPVGSIEINTTGVNPSTYIGGTWVAWGSGRVPAGVDTTQTEFNAVEKTGGEKTHQLTSNEMPSHTHDITVINEAPEGSAPYNSNNNATATIKLEATSPIENWGWNSVAASVKCGEDKPHNNLPPYITCYMWKRTA